MKGINTCIKMFVKLMDNILAENYQYYQNDQKHLFF